MALYFWRLFAKILRERWCHFKLYDYNLMLRNSTDIGGYFFIYSESMLMPVKNDDLEQKTCNDKVPIQELNVDETKPEGASKKKSMCCDSN